MFMFVLRDVQVLVFFVFVLPEKYKVDSGGRRIFGFRSPLEKNLKIKIEN